MMAQAKADEGSSLNTFLSFIGSTHRKSQNLATMTVMLRAAVAVACRCRRSSTCLVSKKPLNRYPKIFFRPCYLSSVARDESKDDDDHVAPSRDASSRDASWKEMYSQLKQYVQQHGHARVPIQYSENRSLGRWVDAQRRQHRLRHQRGEQPSSPLTLQREQLLNQVGMVWDIRDYMWEEKYQELLDFYYEHGHVNVPQRYPSGLGRWIYKQRSDYAARQRGESTQLTTERMVQLSSLGMVWDIPQESWDESYRQLVEFKANHGHTNVAINVEDHFSVWVHSQRREYKKLQAGEYSRITQERIDRLNELNFQWDYQEAMWLEKYEELRRYRQEHGDCIVPKTYGSLGRWVGQQREQYRKYQDGKPASISLERIEMLEKIDFVWNAQDALWRQRLEELAEHVKVNGFGCAPPRKTHNRLARWLIRQHQAYEKMKDGEKVAMNEERAKELRKLGFLID